MNDLTLAIDNCFYSGWTRARVTRGIERCPSDFEVTMTELFPGEFDSLTLDVFPGQSFELYLGPPNRGNLVITGFVDRFTPSIDAHLHSITLAGRGKCQDLVDCSAVWPSGQIKSSTVLDTAQKLAAYYDITVSAADAEDVGLPIDQLNIAFTETPWDVIEKLCRYRALLAYDQPDGNLILSRSGTQAHSSGFQTGKNVQRAAITYSSDQRYSEYQAYQLSMSLREDVGGISPLVVVKDPTITRFRRKNIIAESNDGGDGSPHGGGTVAKMRAQWEASRRWGRSAQLQLTVDSWCDEAGKLWTPNWLVPLDLPELKIEGKRWVISEVSYHMDEQGTSADLTIMPPEAFEPAPILLFPVKVDISKAMKAGK